MKLECFKDIHAGHANGCKCFGAMTAVASLILLMFFSAVALVNADTNGVPLPPPAEVVAGAGDHTNLVHVSWSAVAGATNYIVFRNTTTRAEDADLLTSTTNLFYEDTEVVPDMFYRYRVKAQDETCISDFSAGATGYCRLSAPVWVEATTGTVSHGVEIEWAVVDYAVQYEVWRVTETNADSGRRIVVGNENSTNDIGVKLAVTTNCFYEDRAVRPVRVYQYYIRALGTNGTTGDFSVIAEGWRRPAVLHDYDLDDRADVALYNEMAGAWRLYLSGGNYSESPVEFGGYGFTAVAGDYDGDGATDPAIYNEQSGLWAILMSDDEYHPFQFTFGEPGWRPLAGDFDGDGKADPALYDEAVGMWRVLMSSNGYQEVALEFGGCGWHPVMADFDGDGKTDPALYNAAQGVWMAMFSGNNYAMVTADFGGPWWRAVPADYDGDGRTDPGIYDEITGEWQAMLSGSRYQTVGAVLGGTGWQPVPADYDGDGKADPMVRHVASGEWRGLFSSRGYAPVQDNPGGAGAAWHAVRSGYIPSFAFVAFGDSITYGVGSSSQGPDTGYPVLLESKLKENFGGYFAAVNEGISGEDTAQGAARFAKVLDAHAPRLLLLMEGINDLGTTRADDAIESNLRYMIATAQDRGIYVVLATIPPVISNQYRDRSAQYARIINFNPRIYSIAADYGIPVARVFESITAVPNWQTQLMEQESANHPNDAGYQYLRDAFYNAIADALNDGFFY